MNIFLFHRDLRLVDNTSLIAQLVSCKDIVPIFIFPPEQINPKQNKYFSNNSVQFMMESLQQLEQQIGKFSGKMYYFKGPNLDILQTINKHHMISSIGFNLDYTPYAKSRDHEIIQWANKEKIKLITLEDYPLYTILDNQNVSPISKKPYLVFTSFKNFCKNNRKISHPSNFNKFKFQLKPELENLKYWIHSKQKSLMYTPNEFISIRGGRNNALKILVSIEQFAGYNQQRNKPIIPTTNLSAHLHFNTVSVRQVYHAVLSKLGINNNLITELHWRDFYINITHHYPNVLASQENRSFQSKFDSVKWKYNEKQMQAWKEGKTGFPIVDAGMRQMNITGYMHNRCRMIVASFLAKDLFLDWRQAEQYFANKLVDYSPMQNSAGWQWTVGNGTDSQPYFRIFNPWTQQKNYDPDCEYIKKWIPQLKQVNNKDIHNWNDTCSYHLKRGINYFKPIIDHDQARKKTLEIYSKSFKK